MGLIGDPWMEEVQWNECQASVTLGQEQVGEEEGEKSGL